MAMPSTRPAPTSVTLENFDVLDCGVCFCPLRPPIFQCVVGHVLCSACRDKLVSAGSCHVCRAPISGGYRRNHDMEKLVESIRVLCPYATFGCTAKPAYYDYHLHLQRCLHAPCHCPETACCFAGSTADLTDHFSNVHQWPCSKVRGSQLVEYILLDGFNVLDVIDGDKKHLLLLLVSRERVGRAIAVIFVCPRPRVGKDVAFCHLQVEVSRHHSDGDEADTHLQESEFKLTPTDLSNGLPNPDGCFQLIVPKYAQPDEEETIKVSASIRIVSVKTTSILVQSVSRS